VRKALSALSQASIGIAKTTVFIAVCVAGNHYLIAQQNTIPAVVGQAIGSLWWLMRWLKISMLNTAWFARKWCAVVVPHIWGMCLKMVPHPPVCVTVLTRHPYNYSRDKFKVNNIKQQQNRIKK